jgi:hypothetical protein
MSNDLILIDQLLNQKKIEIGNGIPESDFFEIFSAEQILKDYDLTYEEIEDGIVDNGGDGGIDSIYFFVNDSLFNDDSDLANLKRNVRLELIIIQSKNVTRFSESAIEKLISSMRDLLDLNKSIHSLKQVYIKKLLDKIEDFRKTYIALTSKFPELSISIYYASKATEVHPNVSRKVDILKETVASFFNPCNTTFEFVGASKLLSLARKSPSRAHQLKLSENPISTGQVGFVCLVNLKDYYSFITDEYGKLKKAIFEGNVRDYQGKTDVNEYISFTLNNPNQEDFWWLNNGISIISGKATLSGKTLTIEDPEVVNGLQTSTEIYKHFSNVDFSIVEEKRNILVRVIVPEVESSRDRVIKATNSQTAIPPASLRATDKIHRDIEEYLHEHGLFYDRRKNFYKNQGKPIKDIISIAYLAQAVLSCALFDPSDARARPSSLLKEDEAYNKIFNVNYPIEIYLKCISIARKTESFLKSDSCTLSKSDINNLRFYLAMEVALRLSNSPRPQLKTIASIDLDNITVDLMSSCLRKVSSIFAALGGTDQVAKGRDFTAALLEKHREALQSHHD